MNALPLTAFLSTFTDYILPTYIVIGFGFVLDRVLPLEVKSLSKLILYVVSPCLAFSTMLESSLSGAEFIKIALFVPLITICMWLISRSTAAVLRLNESRTNAFLLGTLFLNSGNYGLSVVMSAFGQAALERALIFFTIGSLLTYTLGVYFASRGKASASQALRNVFLFPLTYAIVAAIVFRALGWTVPQPGWKAIKLVSASAIPLMLLLLGAQLSRTRLSNEWWIVGLATILKLIVEPLVAFPLSHLFGMDDVTRQACIAESGTPTAVMTAVLAVEFDARPDFVTSVILISTLVSGLTMTVLLRLLGA